jgi:phosphatidylserine decarboxylase
MLSARSWEVARSYAVLPLTAGMVLAASRRRVAAVPLALAGTVLLFFRDPERPLDPDPRLIYAAADGVVTDVTTAHAPWLPAPDVVRISTFLSLHNVHVTRSPIAGEIVDHERRDGECLPALSRSAARRNRQSRLTIRGPAGSIGVVLRAGALARRITSWVDTGDHVSAGTRLGLIHFGSRSDVLLAAGSVEPLVRRGDRLRAGQTPIARLLCTAVAA